MNADPTRSGHPFTVQCTNRVCPRPAQAVVTLTEIAPGVTARPALICSGCGCDVYVTYTPAPVATST